MSLLKIAVEKLPHSQRWSLENSWLKSVNFYLLVCFNLQKDRKKERKKDRKKGRKEERMKERKKERKKERTKKERRMHVVTNERKEEESKVVASNNYVTRSDKRWTKSLLGEDHVITGENITYGSLIINLLCFALPHCRDRVYSIIFLLLTSHF